MLSGKGRRRRDAPLDDIVEESIVRHFDLDIAEDDFASAGPLKDVASSVDGVKSDYGEFVQMSAELAEHLAVAAGKRDGRIHPFGLQLAGELCIDNRHYRRKGG